MWREPFWGLHVTGGGGQVPGRHTITHLWEALCQELCRDGDRFDTADGGGERMIWRCEKSSRRPAVEFNGKDDSHYNVLLCGYRLSFAVCGNIFNPT